MVKVTKQLSNNFMPLTTQEIEEFISEFINKTPVNDFQMQAVRVLRKMLPTQKEKWQKQVIEDIPDKAWVNTSYNEPIPKPVMLNNIKQQLKDKYLKP